MKAAYQRGEIGVHDAVFPCAWRPEAMCKGVCDDVGVTEGDLR